MTRFGNFKPIDIQQNSISLKKKTVSYIINDGNNMIFKEFDKED